MPDQALLDEDGQYVLNSTGIPELTGFGILIRWSEVRYLEFLEDLSAGQEHAGNE